MMLTSGIYRIINTQNGQYYIGSAIRLAKRRTTHFSHLRRNKHSNMYLQRSYNMYGEQSFAFDIIEYCEKERLIEREQFWIDSYKISGKNLYNLSPTAGSNLGFKHSEEAKRKIGEANKGNMGMTGMHHSEE